MLIYMIAAVVRPFRVILAARSACSGDLARRSAPRSAASARLARPLRGLDFVLFKFRAMLYISRGRFSRVDFLWPRFRAYKLSLLYPHLAFHPKAIEQHASNHLYHAQRSRETTEASVKQGESRRRFTACERHDSGRRTVRRCCGGTVASQEPCRPVPVRCSSHRSAGVAPPVRWCPCPIGIRWYSFDNVAA